jgi:hypothetical protein
MAKNLGISDYVKEKLQAITPDVAIPLRVLVKDIVEKFPSVKDETSASVRINSVLKQKTVAEKFGRIRGKDGKTYIVLASLVPAKDAVIETSKETVTEVISATEAANLSDASGHQEGSAAGSPALSVGESVPPPVPQES